MRITFTVTTGPLAGRHFHFEGHDVFLVGRSPNAHCRFPEDDPFFSRVHFLVEVNPPQCRLTDMGSRNGTFVNGQKVQQAELKNGDQIKAGKTVLQIAVAEADSGVGSDRPATGLSRPPLPPTAPPTPTPSGVGRAP